MVVNRKAAHLARRADKRFRAEVARAGEKISPCEVFARDGWRCQLCGKKVDMRKAAPHPLSPTVDHIVAVSDGGAHTMVNVQCAHFGCNARRGNRLPALLRLFG